MTEKLTPYLEQLLDKQSFEKQYLAKNEDILSPDDPLDEDSHEPVKGLIHKHKNRALIKLSYKCAAHCRFCTRIRQIGKPEGDISENDIESLIKYLSENKAITELILSGGDPLFTPKTLLLVLQQINKLTHIKIIRIGTRLPFQIPDFYKTNIYSEVFNLLKITASAKALYMLLHVDHPDEITTQVVDFLNFMKTQPVMLLSQSVFLKNVNNSVEILSDLFIKLIELGVKPYYIYHCDNVNGLEPFICEIKEEKKIMQELKKTLSGLAVPQHILDTSKGKIRL